jgi:hypothetical protein
MVAPMWIYKGSAESKFISEINNLPDRTAGICAVTMLEDRLTDAIKKRWFFHQDIFGRMFKYDGPVGSFGTRINFGRIIGLYGDDALNDLDMIRRIRNDFAHKIEAENFSFNDIKQRCQNLRLPDIHNEKFQGNVISVTVPSDSSTEAALDLLTKGWLMRPPSEDYSEPRARFLRTVQILVILFAREIHFPREMPPPRF